MQRVKSTRSRSRRRSSESGYVLLAVMLAFTLLLIALSAGVLRLGQQIKREKEEELIHRGKDYATAVKRYVHKNGGRFPLSIEQLEDTNHVRFLRKRYKDPMTGEDDWRLVHFGEAEVKIPTPNPGLSGSTSPTQGNTLTGTTLGTTPGQTPTGQAPTLNSGGPQLGGAQTQLGGAQPQPGGTGQLGTLQTSNIGTGQPVGGGQVIGVASVNKGQSIKKFNDKDHYDEWLFVYDLRLEQSGGTGVTVAAPRGGTTTSGTSTSGTSGQQNPQQGSPQQIGQPPQTPTQPSQTPP
jgi:type II secretory pathway pseudopilin PulG